jgi:hypothetical protein
VPFFFLQFRRITQSSDVIGVSYNVRPSIRPSAQELGRLYGTITEAKNHGYGNSVDNYLYPGFKQCNLASTSCSAEIPVLVLKDHALAVYGVNGWWSLLPTAELC